MADTSRKLDESDYRIMELLREKKVIVLFNKSDLEPVLTKESFLEAFGRNDVPVIFTSAKENKGIDVFEETLEELFFHGKLPSDNEIVLTNMRHKEAVQNAYNSLKMVQRSLEDEMPEDFYSIDLMSAYTSLGYIIGEEVGDDLVNEIFSKFCMGK